MKKPIETTKWATGGGAQIDEPTLGKKLAGWVKEKPPFQWFNWLFNRIEQWLQFSDKSNNSPFLAAQDPETLDVDISEGVFGINNEYVEYAGGSVTIDPTGIPVGELRLDAVVISDLSVESVVQGTPAVAPLLPAISVSQFIVGIVIVYEGMLTVTEDDIVTPFSRSTATNPLLIQTTFGQKLEIEDTGGVVADATKAVNETDKFGSAEERTSFGDVTRRSKIESISNPIVQLPSRKYLTKLFDTRFHQLTAGDTSTHWWRMGSVHATARGGCRFRVSGVPGQDNYANGSYEFEVSFDAGAVALTMLSGAGRGTASTLLSARATRSAADAEVFIDLELNHSTDGRYLSIAVEPNFLNGEVVLLDTPTMDPSAAAQVALLTQVGIKTYSTVSSATNAAEISFYTANAAAGIYVGDRFMYLNNNFSYPNKGFGGDVLEITGNVNLTTTPGTNIYTTPATSLFGAFGDYLVRCNVRLVSLGVADEWAFLDILKLSGPGTNSSGMHAQWGKAAAIDRGTVPITRKMIGVDNTTRMQLIGNATAASQIRVEGASFDVQRIV